MWGRQLSRYGMNLTFIRTIEAWLAKKGCRCLWHYVGGFLVGFWGHPNNAAVMASGNGLFVAYEIWQDIVTRRKKRPDSHNDIREWATGFLIGYGLAWGFDLVRG